MPDLQDLLTLGDLRRETGEPAHILNYAISTYKIEPRGRVGIIRVWNRDDLEQIKSALRRIGRGEACHV